MHETAAERERRLRQLGGGESLWFDTSYIMSMWADLEVTNPCAEIMIATPQRCTLGDNPLIKYNEYKFNF